ERHGLHVPLTPPAEGVTRSLMETGAIVLCDIVLESPTDEDTFLSWFAEARALLTERAKPIRLHLLAPGRGVYTGLLQTRLRGAYKLVAQDRPWQELNARRPRGTLAARELRVWHEAEDGTRDVTTTTLRAWLAERTAGKRDFLLVNALPADAFAEKHIP